MTGLLLSACLLTNWQTAGSGPAPEASGYTDRISSGLGWRSPSLSYTPGATRSDSLSAACSRAVYIFDGPAVSIHAASAVRIIA